MCSACDEYDIELDIHGPAQLRRIVGKLQAAVREARLNVAKHPGDSEYLPAFGNLDLADVRPDTLSYEFRCGQCGREFRLSCEAYHGAGGHWGRT